MGLLLVSPAWAWAWALGGAAWSPPVSCHRCAVGATVPASLPGRWGGSSPPSVFQAELRLPPPEKMAALHTAPGSPAAQPERAEDGSECNPEQEEEEEEERGDEAEETEEEEMEVEEEEGQDVVEEEEATGLRAGQGGPVEQVEVELQEDQDVEEEVAEEWSPALGTQAHLSRGGAKSPVLQEKGKRRELALGREGGWEGGRVGGKEGGRVGSLAELFGPLGWSRSCSCSWDVRAQALELLPLLLDGQRWPGRRGPC